MKCFYEHRMHLLQSPSCVFLVWLYLSTNFLLGFLVSLSQGCENLHYLLRPVRKCVWACVCVCVRWGRPFPSWSSLGAQPCLILPMRSASPIKTSTVNSSFLNTYRKYMKIYSFKGRWENTVFFSSGHFVLKAVGRTSFSRKMVRTLAMVSPSFFN